MSVTSLCNTHGNTFAHFQPEIPLLEAKSHRLWLGVGQRRGHPEGWFVRL